MISNYTITNTTATGAAQLLRIKARSGDLEPHDWTHSVQLKGCPSITGQGSGFDQASEVVREGCWASWMSLQAPSSPSRPAVLFVSCRHSSVPGRGFSHLLTDRSVPATPAPPSWRSYCSFPRHRCIPFLKLRTEKQPKLQFLVWWSSNHLSNKDGRKPESSRTPYTNLKPPLFLGANANIPSSKGDLTCIPSNASQSPV